MFDHNDEVVTMENPAGMDNQDTNIGEHDDNDDNGDDDSDDNSNVKPGPTIPCTAPPAPAIWHRQARTPDCFVF